MNYDVNKNNDDDHKVKNEKASKSLECKTK